MTLFRPCIDLHEGRVKQIVGGTLGAEGQNPQENFVSSKPASWFSELYREKGTIGGHVIMLGPGSEAEAKAALAAWPGGLQIGGGIHPGNAAEWLDAGASHVIATSWLFDDDGDFSQAKLDDLLAVTGVERLVIDLSCRRLNGNGEPVWIVAMNKWRKPTNLSVCESTLSRLAPSCAEFLIHAADVEGRQSGIDVDLVTLLGEISSRPVTYAGGARHVEDMELVARLSSGRVDITIGSALDIFGGSGARFEDCVAFNQRQELLSTQ